MDVARIRDVERQRSDLSAATWRVLAERGPAGLTVRAVADAAGCTTGLVMHAFPTKRALLGHARELLFERASARVDEIERTTDDPAERLSRVAHALLAFGRDGGDEARVWVGFLGSALADEQLADTHRRGNRALLDRMIRLIRGANPALTERAARSAATELVALIEGFNTLATVDPERYGIDLQRGAVDRFLEGLSLRAPDVE